MGCGGGCMKIVLVSCNIVTCILGIVVCIASAVGAMQSDALLHKLAEVAEQDGVGVHSINVLTNSMWGLCGFGFVIFLIGFVGCIAAWTENRFLLGLYISVLLFFTCLEFVLAVGLIAARPSVEPEVRRVLNNAIHSGNETNVQLLEKIEAKLDCCGSSGWEDKCFPIGAEQGGSVHKHGCNDAVWAVVSRAAALLSMACMCAVFVQMLAIILACNLCVMAKSNKSQYEKVQ